MIEAGFEFVCDFDANKVFQKTQVTPLKTGGDSVEPSFESSGSYKLTGQNTQPADWVKREKII